MAASKALLLLVAAATASSASNILQTQPNVFDNIITATSETGEAVKEFVKTNLELNKLKDELVSLTSEADKLWQDVATEFPEAWAQIMADFTPKTSTKPFQRKDDSEWDFIVKGEDVQALWTEDAQGAKRREIDGNLENYNMRIKKVDPSSLGIDKVKQYSGYLDDKEQDKHLFYWFFESRNDPKNDPVVLWLNGGPGCSSLTGLFMELGPSFINSKGEPVYNPYSWNNNASVIFLDQPVNVGFSYSSSSVSNTPAAGKDVYALMTLFFKQFPEYASQPFHIAGESYAGHYIPVFASEILSHKNRNINLQSLLIGNGLTDGLAQYPYYRPMACGEGGYKGVLGPNECQSMDNALPRCLSLIQNCYDSESVWSCVPASIYCNNAILAPYQRTGQNVYDIREKCKGQLCYEDIEWIASYLNKKEVMKALGVEVSRYDGCNFDINRNFLFQGDWMKPYMRLVPGLLAQIPVLIYAGDADFICNWLGNRAWTEALAWPGKQAYNRASTHNLTLSADESVIGTVKASGNFSFVKLNGGGHMVPHDQPAASLDMFNRWLKGEWWEQ